MITISRPRRRLASARGMANLIAQVDMPETTGHVYVLRDPRDSTPRYVGVTLQLPAKRLQQHVTAGRSMRHLPVARWIGSLLKAGLEPVMEVLPSAGDPYEVEVVTIAAYRALGYPLLNVTPGGRGGGIGPKSDEHAARIGDAHRGRKKPPRTSEWRAAHAAKMTGRRRPDEVKRKISATHQERRVLISKTCKCGTEFQVIPSRVDRVNWCGPQCPARPDGTACRNGHLWTPENTRLYHGTKYCIECDRARGRGRTRKRGAHV